MGSIWSAPISRGIIPVELDLEFDDPRDVDYPWRVVLPDQYMLVPAIGMYAPFVLPIAQGYRTDGPSIPWYAQWAVPKDGPIWAAAIPHDIGCSTELFGRDVDTVNQIMRIAMLQVPKEIPAWQQKAVFQAIDKFCWITYRSHDPAEVARDRALVLDASKRLQRIQPHLFRDHAPVEAICPAYRMAA